MCITIYHNNRWSKSRETLQLLRDNGHEPNIIEYLKNPPNVNELNNICKTLSKRPKNERAFLLIPIGYPGDDAVVPDLNKKVYSDYANII